MYQKKLGPPAAPHRWTLSENIEEGTVKYWYAPVAGKMEGAGAADNVVDNNDDDVGESDTAEVVKGVDVEVGEVTDPDEDAVADEPGLPVKDELLVFAGLTETDKIIVGLFKVELVAPNEPIGVTVVSIEGVDVELLDGDTDTLQEGVGNCNSEGGFCGSHPKELRDRGHLHSDKIAAKIVDSLELLLPYTLKKLEDNVRN